MEYQAFEAVLAKLHKIDPDDMPAFNARLRQLRNSGIPKVTNPGKGQRRMFTDVDLWETHLALTMIEVGLPPHRVSLAFDAWIRPHNVFQEVRNAEGDSFLVFESYLNAGKGADIDLVHHRAQILTLTKVTDYLKTKKRPSIQIIIDLAKLTAEL